MSVLTIKRKLTYMSFGKRVWSDEELKVPLTYPVEDAKISIFFERDSIAMEERIGFDVSPTGRIEMEFDPAPTQMVNDLRSKSAGLRTATKIYRIYKIALERFESLLLSKGGQKYLFGMHAEAEGQFFGDGGFRGEPVKWSLDDSEFKIFKPKLPKSRKRNPMYKADQLLTVGKWEKLQEAASNNEFPESELLELYRIRNKAHFRENTTAAIEASIISETLLRQFGLKSLKAQGFSNNKIKKIRDELTYNNLLNVILPLALTKGEFAKISGSVLKVDHLRKIRNDIVHGNKADHEFESSDILEGTEAAIKLVEFLKKKIE